MLENKAGKIYSDIFNIYDMNHLKQPYRNIQKCRVEYICKLLLNKGLKFYKICSELYRLIHAGTNFEKIKVAIAHISDYTLLDHSDHC